MIWFKARACRSPSRSVRSLRLWRSSNFSWDPSAARGTRHRDWREAPCASHPVLVAEKHGGLYGSEDPQGDIQRPWDPASSPAKRSRESRCGHGTSDEECPDLAYLNQAEPSPTLEPSTTSDPARADSDGLISSISFIQSWGGTGNLSRRQASNRTGQCSRRIAESAG